MNTDDNKMVLHETLSIVHAYNNSKDMLQAEKYFEAKEFCNAVLSDDNIIGDADDYHNFSVNYYRYDDYMSAYNIVDKGLSLYPMDVDLLADAICYGMNCNKDCNDYYERIKQIPYSLWSWRAFCFVIDYLLQVRTLNSINQYEENINTALEISRSFVQMMPDNSRSYSKMLDILRLLRKKYLLDGANEDMLSKLEDDFSLLHSAVTKTSGIYGVFGSDYVQELSRNNKYDELLSYYDSVIMSIEAFSKEQWGKILMGRAVAETLVIINHISTEEVDSEKINMVYQDYVHAMTWPQEKENIVTGAARCHLLAQKSGISMPEQLESSFNKYIC